MGLGSTAPFRRPEEKISREIVLRPPKLGVVVFNNPANPTSGVAAVAGRSPIVFESRAELPSDVLWISTASQAVAAQNFRPGDYLRVRPSALAEDLGVYLEDVMQGLPEVARAVGSVRDILAQAYPWNDFSTDWSQTQMTASISRVLPMPGEIPEILESPLAQAMQTYSVVQDRPTYSTEPIARFTLRTNRLRYAQWLLDGTFPVGGWHFEPVGGKHKLEDFLNPERPCLVEASIEFGGSLTADGVTPSLIAFGSSTFGGRKEVIRRWISQPELAWLCRYAKIHIVSVLFCREAQRLPQELMLPPVLLADPLLALSVSAGVAAECHWNGLARGNSVMRTGSSATARFVTVYHPIGVWLRALDRAYCFAMARKAVSMGFAVSSYGYGAITVWSSKDDIKPLVDLSEALMCCHPNLAALNDRIAVYSGEPG